MISEVEFKTFCNDFVKKYENQSFYNILCKCGYHPRDKTFTIQNFDCYKTQYNETFFKNPVWNCCFYRDDYGNVMINSENITENICPPFVFDDLCGLYDVFKLNEKDEEYKVTLEMSIEVNLEDIVKGYKEEISKILGISSENIKINLKRG